MRIVIALAAAAALGGCGTTMGDRGLSGGMIGGAAGLVVGGPVAGVVVGAGVGMLTEPDQINLGEPAWK